MEAEQRKIKFAVIGCGHIGKRHAEMITRNEECELMALADIKEKETIGIEKYEVPFFNSIEQLLQSDIETDVISIATPNGFHAEQAMMAMDAGNHVVIEKPMSLTKADAEKVLAKASEKSLEVFAVMQNRYSPPAQWIKEVVKNGKLGRLFMVQLNCFWNRDERYYKNNSWHGKKELDGGTLFTQFSHFVDMMHWLFGGIKNIQSRFADYNHQHLTEFEDSGIVTFDFENGSMGSIHFSTAVWDKNFESSMTIIAEKGTVKIGGQYMDKVEYCHIKDYELPELPATNPGNDYGHYKGSAQNHHFVIQHVVNVLKGREKNEEGCDAMKVIDTIERIYNSNNKG